MTLDQAAATPRGPEKGAVAGLLGTFGCAMRLFSGSAARRRHPYCRAGAQNFCITTQDIQIYGFLLF